MKYQNCILSFVPCLLIQAMVVIPVSSMLGAQEVVQPVPVGTYELQGEGLAVPQGAAVAVAPAAMGMPSKEMVGGAKQFQLLNLYAIEISRIDAAAKLDETQKSKLTAAVKEIAAERAQEYARVMDTGMGGAVMPGAGAGPAPNVPQANEPPLKLEEIKSYAEVEANTKLMLGSGFIPQADHREDADWQKVVKSVLKPEQQAKYEEAIAAERKVVDKTMIDAGIAVLSVELVLSNDQARQLTALAMEQLATARPAATVAEDLATVGMAMPGMILPGMNGVPFSMLLGKVDTKKLRDVLDPQQFELLDLKLENHRRFAADMSGAAIITH